MNEVILNIYLVINSDYVEEFRATAYNREGTDEEKIKFLKSKTREDFDSSYKFNAPTNRLGQYMKYYKFAKLEKRGRHFELFEEIFTEFDVPQNPLICVTPVVDGKIIEND